MSTAIRITLAPALLIASLSLHTGCTPSRPTPEPTVQAAPTQPPAATPTTPPSEQLATPSTPTTPVTAVTPATPVTPVAPATPPPPPPPTPTLRELFPGLRIDITNKLIELDATVPIDAHNPKTPRVFLELFVCPPDTKEHEAVAMTRVAPSRVHAALLMLGLEPGTPGTYAFEGKKLIATPPTGPRLRVTIAHAHTGTEIETPATDWAISTRDSRTLTQHAPAEGFVFAGSLMIQRQGREFYKADIDGTLVGLTSFASESIAWTQIYNPDASTEEPQWIANAAVVPPVGTPVIIRIRPE